MRPPASRRSPLTDVNRSPTRKVPSSAAAPPGWTAVTMCLLFTSMPKPNQKASGSGTSTSPDWPRCSGPADGVAGVQRGRQVDVVRGSRAVLAAVLPRGGRHRLLLLQVARLAQALPRGGKLRPRRGHVPRRLRRRAGLRLRLHRRRRLHGRRAAAAAGSQQRRRRVLIDLLVEQRMPSQRRRGRRGHRRGFVGGGDEEWLVLNQGRFDVGRRRRVPPRARATSPAAAARASTILCSCSDSWTISRRAAASACSCASSRSPPTAPLSAAAAASRRRGRCGR